MNFNEIWLKINIVIRNILLALICFLLSRLIWVLFLVGIQIKDTQVVIENLLEIVEALAKKLKAL